MKKQILSLTLALFMALPAESLSPPYLPETWANWERRMNDAFKDFNARNLPGQTLGILLPSDPRKDILALTAYGYSVLSISKVDTVVILMPAPDNYPLNGIVMPDMDVLSTQFGNFQVDTFLRTAFQNIEFPIFVDNRPFGPTLPPLIQTQLAAVKFLMQGKVATIKFLPIMVNLKDLNSQSKDLGPYLAEKIKEIGFEQQVRFVIAGNLTQGQGEEALIESDNNMMDAIRNLDVDSVIEMARKTKEEDVPYQFSDASPIALGLLALRWLGADHGDVLSYAHSGQLVLTKNKKKPIGYSVVGFPSEPGLPPRVPHVEREKMVDKFDELFRSDILTVARQACASILDPTAAKPPSLLQKLAAKKWPVYVSLYTPAGGVGGEAGTHKKELPLEEAIRKYAFDAVKRAKPQINKTSFANYTVEVSIPYGFEKVTIPEELIPLLNGIIVDHKQKSYGFHPNEWRKFPSAHQLLGAICFKLGLKPWAYATRQAKIKSFRVLAFNEKEPFQDLGAEQRKKKKKKKKKDDDEFGLDSDFGGDTGGFPF